MEPVIVSRGFLHLKGKTLALRTREGTRTIPIRNLKTLFISGDVTVSVPALLELAKRGIHVHFLTYYGEVVATLISPSTPPASEEIIEAQINARKNPVKFKAFAVELVLAEERAFEWLLLELLGDGAKPFLEEMRNHSSKVHTANTPFEFMGIEAALRNVYYRAFSEIIGKRFKRTRRPPEDSLNAYMSYGNMYLYGVATTEIIKVGLMPAIGFLHSSIKRKPSLSLDIAEPFKPVIVDYLALQMADREFTDDTKREFAKRIRERLATPFPVEGGKTLRDHISDTARSLRKFILGDGDVKIFRF